MTNQSIYEREAIVREYASSHDLQKPEISIMQLLGAQLGGMRMLDIGVGAGRTTAYLSHKVREYVGVDYSSSMIEVCKRRFPDLAQRGCFKVADARRLDEFDSNYFDLVLFSFNGIDYVNHDDRLRILSEVKRVTRAGGCFVFSAHNINCDLGQGGRIKLCVNPVRLFYRITKFAARKYAGHVLKVTRATAEYAIVRDTAHGLQLKTYYIGPSAQIRQLESHDFSDVKVFSLRDGHYLFDQAEADAATDDWLYYLCVSR